MKRAVATLQCHLKGLTKRALLTCSFLCRHLNNQGNNQWYKDGVKLIQDNLKVKPNTNTAKNAILFLGDGMGITTITAARILDGQMKGQSGEENVLSWERFPWSAMAKTYAVDLQGADSAASATAFLNGVKTRDGKKMKMQMNVCKVSR